MTEEEAPVEPAVEDCPMFEAMSPEPGARYNSQCPSFAPVVVGCLLPCILLVGGAIGLLWPESKSAITTATKPLLFKAKP